MPPNNWIFGGSKTELLGIGGKRALRPVKNRSSNAEMAFVAAELLSTRIGLNGNLLESKWAKIGSFYPRNRGLFLAFTPWETCPSASGMGGNISSRPNAYCVYRESSIPGART